jgi:hypothetical protein
MPEVKFDFDITDESMSVRLVAPARTRFYALACFVGVTLFLLCVLLFAPGKQSGHTRFWCKLGKVTLPKTVV